MTKFLLAILVAYAGWWLWRGPRRAAPRKAPQTKYSEDSKLSDARALLGLDEQASEAEIRAAHRRLIVAVHPDRGGSAELTRRINVARDILLHRTN